ncbi:hypothetical protein [Sphingomonas sp. YR710]|uniref:hypothetical protein n=1 Tax=Sphingomonas sp. YR710 TaxID=1882773 RepID=UPI00115FC653|nr:hypothetical protein [Sphingomonas sp. YR710]
MSLIFMVGDRVYKMKKALLLGSVDFTTIEARRRNCERELQLNRALAPGIYLDVVAIVRRRDGTLAIGGDGMAVEWLLAMKRLDHAGFLSALIVCGRARPVDIAAIGEKLADFYTSAHRIALTVADHLEWWMLGVAKIEASLNHFLPHLTVGKVATALARLNRFLANHQPWLAERVAHHRILDGHGDLRPEHVYIGPPLLLLDRLEFDARLRWSDPFDEASFLGLECEHLGAPWVGPQLVALLAAHLRDAPKPALLGFYRGYRATLRASLSIEHLRDARPRTPDLWPRLAEAYLDIALSDPVV